MKLAACGLCLCFLALAVPKDWAESNAVVVVAHDSEAIQSFDPNPNRVRKLVDRGIVTLTGKKTIAEAWREFAGSNDIVGIKIVARGGPLFSVRKDVTAGIVAGLKSAGVPERNIIIWDKYQSDLIEAGYRIQEDTNAVRVLGVIPGIGFDPEATYRFPHAGKLIWGDLLFGKDRAEEISAESHLTRLITQQITKLINVAVLTDHYEVGLSGSLLNLALGSVDNVRRFPNDAAACESAVAEICSLPAVRDKTVLHIIDGLLGQYTLGPSIHPQSTWHNGTLYFSTDPVALDTVALGEIESQRRRVGLPSVIDRARYIRAAGEAGLGIWQPEAIERITAGK